MEPDFPAPRFIKRPESTAYSSGQEVHQVCELVGLMLDGHQDLVFDVACSENEDGEWAATNFGFCEPRQNGKSITLLARTVAGVLLYEEPRIIHSAHEVKTAMESFNKLKALCENYDALSKRVKRIISVNGREGIQFNTGTEVTYIARSKSSGRGFSASTVLLDEAQEMSFDVLAAILPTMSAVPNSQMWMCGTPPAPNMKGEVFTRQRQRALAGGSPRQGWIEWGVGPDTSSPEAFAAYDYADRANWLKANPACPDRIDIESIEDEFNAMDEETFRRDRLGEWDDDTGSAIIPIHIWDKQFNPDMQETTSLAYLIEKSGLHDISIAIDMNPARTATSLSMAGFTGTGKTRKSFCLLAQGPGSEWVIQEVRALIHNELDLKFRSVVVDAASPAASLVGPLRMAGVQVTPMQTRDMVMACGQMYDGFFGGTVFHAGQPEMTDAMKASVKRNLLDSWALSRSNSDQDISPFVSGTMALYGVTMPKVKRPKIGVRGRRKVSV